MLHIPMPRYDFRTKKEGKSTYIFDNIRKKYVKLTPEEIVRQQVIRYFIEELGYRASLTSVEMGHTLNNLDRRSDIVFSDTTGKVRVVVECKAVSVKLTPAVFEQVKRYNLTLKADFLIITNGSTFVSSYVDYESGEYRFLKYVPTYQQVLELA